MKKIASVEYATLLLWFGMVVSFLYTVWMQEWKNVFVVFMAAFLSGVPYVLEKNFGVTIAKRLRFGIIAFLFATLIIGQVNSFYTQFPWWDTALHFVSGLGLTVIGFAILTSIYPRHNLRIKPYFTSLFAFAFTAMMAALWEVFEFATDTLKLTEGLMQAGNTDTMSDIIVALLAALIVCVGGFRYLTVKERNIVGDMINDTRI